MNYHPEDFKALSETVEAEGGNCLADPCEPKEFRLPMKDFAGKKIFKPFFTVGCGYSARMELPYDPSLHIRLMEEDDNSVEPITVVDHLGEDAEPGMVTVCAVDDCVGLWPRYVGVVSDRSYQT